MGNNAVRRAIILRPWLALNDNDVNSLVISAAIRTGTNAIATDDHKCVALSSDPLRSFPNENVEPSDPDFG